jgi:hypothetical protein
MDPNPAVQQQYAELVEIFTESYLALRPVYARLATWRGARQR